MTGFASAQTPVSEEGASTASANTSVSLEIRSINSRFLDFHFRLSDDLRVFEPMLRDMLGSSLRRGKIEVRAQCVRDATQTVDEPSVALLQRLNHLQTKIQSWMPQAQPLSVSQILQMGQPPSPAQESLQACVKQATSVVLASLQESRQNEGARLCTMLLDRVSQLQSLTDRAEPLVPQLVAQQRERFLHRWQEALESTQTGVSSDQARDRALAEATAFAIRIDVAEELTRLRSHLEEIQNLLKRGGDIGKRLEFLIQELHREANTLGSKSATIELSRIGVDMKVLIEQMREQVQNIE